MEKKGFTLIELLAVFVVLAIIALITVPIVLKIINNSNSESVKRSVEGYARAIENGISEWQMLNPGTPYSEYPWNNVDTKGQTVSCTHKIINNNGKFSLGCCSTTKSAAQNKYYNYVNDSVLESNSCDNVDGLATLEETTYNGKKYLIIANDNDNYVTALAKQSIKLSDYAGKYSATVQTVNTEETIQYYTANDCSSNDDSGCDVTYDTTIVSKIIDDWATATFTNNELVTVSGHKARLLNADDLATYGFAKNNTWYESSDATAQELFPKYQGWTQIRDGRLVYTAHGTFIYGDEPWNYNAVRPVVHIKKSFLID